MKWLLLGLLGGSLISGLIVWQGQRPTHCEHGMVITSNPGDTTTDSMGQRTPGAALKQAFGRLPHVASDPRSPDEGDDAVTYYSYDDAVRLEAIIKVERGRHDNWFATSVATCSPAP